MNLLFLASPASIHDIKWITYFSETYSCYLISRNPPNQKQSLKLKRDSINYLGTINDYSTIKFWKNKAEANKLNSLIINYGIDIFHILYTEPNILWAIYKPKFNIPIIATNRGSDILVTINSTFKSKSLLNYLVVNNYKKAFANCSQITCTSKLQLATIEQLKLSKKTCLIKTGIDISMVETFANNNLIDQASRPYIMFPRNMRPVYNHELSINAIQVLPASIKNKYDFIFIDADSTDSNYVKKISHLINSIKDAKIKFINSLSQAELIPLINKASLVVMTNLSDGTPVSAMETMYLKTPLLLSPLPYDKDIFCDIKKFDAFTSQSLAKAINIVITHPPNTKNKELNKQIIIEKGDRVKEMSKLELLYNKSLNCAIKK